MQALREYVKISEAAELLGVAENTLRSWADLGKVPSTRNPVNGYRLFRREDLKAFLKQLSRGVKSRPPAKGIK